MVYGRLYRHLLLPLFDGVIKRRSTMRHWRNAESSQWWTRERLESLQLDALRNLLTHAANTCPYYADLFASRGLKPEQIATLDDFVKWPLLDKGIIRQHRMAMRTTVDLPLMTKATGGSSGEPLQFDLDHGSNDRRTAMMYRGYGWAGGAPGSKQLFIWGTAVGKVSTWKRLKTRLHHDFDRHKIISCFEFTPEKMAQHVAKLNAYRPEVIVAYTNPVYEFARYIEATGQSVWRPQSIIVGAEKLHDFQRTLIERVFKAPVFETYGSREFMLIGAECQHLTGLHLSLENLLVEVLDENGRPTPHGEEGNVVITDLFNYGMPFVRYVNGDRAVAGFEMCPCGRGLPLLKKVVGRQLDTLQTPDGRRVPGEFFPHLIKDFPAIRRFQVVQADLGTIVLKVVVNGELLRADQERLLETIRQCTGEAVRLDLQLVDDIPLTKAGKLKVVVSAM